MELTFSTIKAFLAPLKYFVWVAEVLLAIATVLAFIFLSGLAISEPSFVNMASSFSSLVAVLFANANVVRKLILDRKDRHRLRLKLAPLFEDVRISIKN